MIFDDRKILGYLCLIRLAAKFSVQSLQAAENFSHSLSANKNDECVPATECFR